MMVKY